MAINRNLGSWKNLAGCALGLLSLHFAGLAGSYRVAVVIGLYCVGALRSELVRQLDLLAAAGVPDAPGRARRHTDTPFANQHP